MLRSTVNQIHLSKADVTDVELAYVTDAMRSNWIAPLGPHVDAFEVEVAERVGVRGAVALSSGTAALHLALLALGARSGTCVVVPSMTFAASANAIVYTGATPVFVDSLLQDGNIDPEVLFQALDELEATGQHVAAVMAVDLFGRCVDFSSLEPELEGRGIPLLEDAAEAMGARTIEGAAGSFGAASVLSFNGNKIMTTSGGGMLLSDRLEILDRCRFLATQARQPVAHYEHEEIGFNYRLSNILAALGRGQLTRLDEMIGRRRQIRRRYRDQLGSLPGVRFLGDDAGGDDMDNCWLTSIVLDPELVPISAPAVLKVLSDQQIEARRLWKPMHLQPVFADSRAFTNGNAEYLFDNGVTLPSGSALTDADIRRTIEALRGCLSGE